MVIYSIVLTLPAGVVPPPHKPRVAEEQAARNPLCAGKSPKSAAFPVEEIVI